MALLVMHLNRRIVGQRVFTIYLPWINLSASSSSLILSCPQNKNYCILAWNPV